MTMLQVQEYRQIEIHDRPRRRIKEARCRCCGCTDAAACAAGCHWVLIDRRQAVGICSSCDPLIEQAIQHLLQQAQPNEAIRP